MPEARLDSTRAPRTQQQRREETRRALLDAAVQSLIEVGFARTTTLEVQRRAEVSRGALLHHFPSKAELLVAAVDHLAEMRAREMKAFASQLPPERTEPGERGDRGERSDRGEREAAAHGDPAPGGDARTGAVLGLLWQCFSGTFFKVSMELRTAARTDPELRRVLVAAERSLRDRIVAQSRTLFGRAVAEHPGLERALDLTLQLMIGAAMTSVLHGHVSQLDDLIDDWKALFPLVLSHASTRGPAGGPGAPHELTDRKKLKGKR
ncbi:MAG TPA: helix-turn-helix domain-containing protein [Kofleriaceae bacterium]|jgi:AcrR family transcriptional regulator|nr:helix-turn-helix domain-containing protein [Kofleriaceae bacterium]